MLTPSILRGTAIACYIVRVARKITGLTARDQHVTARLRADTVFDLDKMRGPTPRSRFLEYLIAQEKRRRDQLKDGK